jgi:hypothetical protein
MSVAKRLPIHSSPVLATHLRPVAVTPLLFFAIEFALLRWERLWELFRLVLHGHVLFWDFQIYYAAGHLARAGLGDQIYELASLNYWIERLTGNPPESALGYLYPPFFALALSPLSWLSYAAAFRLWFGLNGAALLLLGLVLWRLAAPAPAWQRALLLAVTFSSDAAYYVMAGGQVSAFIVLALAGGLLLLRQGREAAAGALLALAVVKPQLVVGVLLLLVVRARRRVLLVFAATVGALSLACLPFLGPKTYIEMFRFLGGQTEAGGLADVNYATMHNWRAFLATLDLDSNGVVYAGTFLLTSAVSVLGALWSWRAGPARGSGRGNQEWAVALLLPLLFTPHLWTQDLLILSLVGALALSQHAQAGVDRRHQATVAILILAGYVILSEAWSLTRHEISLTVLPLLAMFIWACVQPWGPRGSSHPPRINEGRREPTEVLELAEVQRLSS